MIHSMTGYGQFRIEGGDILFLIEARSLNNRFLDIVIKMPETIVQLEDKIKEIVKSRLKRGRVNITISEERSFSQGFKIDITRARRYISIFKQFKNRLKIPGELDLNFLLNFPQIFNLREERKSLNEIWPLIKKGAERALDSLVEARIKEGRNIQKSFVSSADVISKSLKKIEDQAPDRVKHQKEKLERMLKEFLPDLNLNNPRLTEELTLFAIKVDITEEISRLKSHLQAFFEIFDRAEPVGRRFEFIIQEMGREINTLSAKSDDFLMSSHAIVIKEELEKIKEQVLNIE